MIKEKAILIFLGLVIIGLILESLFIVFPIDDKPQKAKKEFFEITSNKKNEDLVLLSVPGWGEDIFYDRGN